MEERIAHLERVQKALLKRLPPCELDQHTLGDWQATPYHAASGFAMAVYTNANVRNCLGCDHYRISCDHRDSMIKCSKGALKNKEHTSMCTVCGFTELYQGPPPTVHTIPASPGLVFGEKRPRPMYDGPPSLFGSPAAFSFGAPAVATPAFGVPASAPEVGGPEVFLRTA